MADNRQMKDSESALHERLAPHVDGELLAVTPVRCGGFMVSGQRMNGGLMEWLLPKMLGEEGRLPCEAWLAVTREDVYVFRRASAKKELGAPLRRWPRAGLQSVTVKPFGKGQRVVLKLETGKKAIFMVIASEALKERIRAALEPSSTPSTRSTASVGS